MLDVDSLRQGRGTMVSAWGFAIATTGTVLVQYPFVAGFQRKVMFFSLLARLRHLFNVGSFGKTLYLCMIHFTEAKISTW